MKQCKSFIWKLKFVFPIKAQKLRFTMGKLWSGEENEGKWLICWYFCYVTFTKHLLPITVLNSIFISIPMKAATRFKNVFLIIYLMILFLYLRIAIATTWKTHVSIHVTKGTSWRTHSWLLKSWSQSPQVHFLFLPKDLNANCNM